MAISLADQVRPHLANSHAAFKGTLQQANIEKSLLDSNWRGNQTDLSAVEELCHLCFQGQFQQVLTSPLARNVFGLDAVTKLPVLNETAAHPLVLLAVAVSCLESFVQSNWTGPELHFSSLDVCSGDDLSEADLQEAAVLALTLSGEPIYHLARHAPLLYMAQLVFLPKQDQPNALESVPSLPIWQLRTILVHLRCLEDPVPAPASILTAVENYRDQLKQFPDEQDLVAAQTLLLGHYHRILSSVVPSSERQASLLFLQAAQEAGLEYEVTGILGKRTKFQRDEKAQLVVLAQSRARKDEQKVSDANQTKAADVEQPVTLALNDDTLLEKTLFTASSDSTRLSNLDPNNQPDLHPFDQALLLSLSFNHANESPGHGLTATQIASFVTRVLDKSNNWSVHSMGLLLRSRLEASRTRTVERGVLQMQSLVDQLKLEAQAGPVKQETGAPASERLKYFHALALPPRWELERELAGRYLNIGVTKSALEIFQRLEMWEDVARCYTAIGQKERAIKVVRDLIEGTQSESEQVMRVRKDEQRAIDPQRQGKLHCILGELTRDVEELKKAWEVSGHRSSRAMRSLAGIEFSDRQYADCSLHLRQALAINPLNMRCWFILGCSDMKLEAWSGAEEAFVRCVALDDEDAESWANLAAAHLRIADAAGDDEEAKISLDRKRAAFQCLKQAVKHNRDSWRIWSNYMIVCISVGEFAEACTAVRMMVELQGDKLGPEAVDLPVLERLVDSVTRETAAEVAADHARGLSARVTDLFETVLLPRFSTEPRIFKAHAKLCLWKGDYEGCLDSHLKAYRCIMQDPEIDTDLAHFKDAAQEVEEMVSLWQSLGSQEKAQGTTWKSQSRSMLRSLLGRARGSFEDEPEYEMLKDLLKQVQQS